MTLKAGRSILAVMDVTDLRQFYDSRLGATTRRLIAHRLHTYWPSLSGGTLLGLGFATPYLDGWRDSSVDTMAFMMARQGVYHWPHDQPPRTTLVDEFELPLLESCVDFALIVHGLELTDNPREMLEEIWRVLSPQGRALFVVPNRRGMWARFDSTPFGYGQPFSRSQLQSLLKETRFSPMNWTQALFMPPSERSFVVGSATAWERIGSRVSPAFSGVIVVEAMKQVYALPKGKRARRMLPRLRPILAPAPAARQSGQVPE